MVPNAQVGDRPDLPPRAGGDDAQQDAPHHNEVLLVGRLVAEPQQRELADGSVIVTWRVSITRPAEERRRGIATDAVNCMSHDEAVQRSTRQWRLGDIVEVGGALRRRVWRTTAGVASLYEVEAATVARRAPAAEALQR